MRLEKIKVAVRVRPPLKADLGKAVVTYCDPNVIKFYLLIGLD